ncbi:RND transporter [Bradyrhizobium macuxiense]|uniref:RND transporter n=2 Tax=Bradyrhizobium macuxiense TaxID=1755647 RepID=A0A120FR37_9BRAD|nr:efflux RND transporter periplasmic adaptor subunit [Bradyrhizobium macuxiense]KWV59524.1 RND transporter [Bradyrhizobium macuxiense]
MVRRMAIMLVLVGVAFAAIFGFEAFKARMIQKAIAGLRNPPQTVSTITAATQPWQKRLEAVGSARAEKGADLSAQVSGIVKAIHFKSGAKVEQGTLLVELEAADDIAHLESLKAMQALAQLNYDRDTHLRQTDAVSQQTADTDLATLKSDQAQVAQQQALVGYKSITAPFSGQLGIRQVDLGQYIAPGTPIVTLQQLDPIFIDLYLPQQALAQIKVGQEVSAKVDTYPDQKFTGRILAINPLVNAASRNVQVRATFDNPDEKLRPGMFATVDIDVGSVQHYVTLPKTAIYYNSYGDIAYLIKEGHEGKGESKGGEKQYVAEQVFVKTGDARGDQVAVLDGVKPGDVVVSSGQNKLHNGSPVLIDNKTPIPFSANPQVSEE